MGFFEFWISSFSSTLSSLEDPRGLSPPSAHGKEGEVLQQPALLIEPETGAQPGLTFHVKGGVTQGFFIFIIDPHQFCISAQTTHWGMSVSWKQTGFDLSFVLQRTQKMKMSVEFTYILKNSKTGWFLHTSAFSLTDRWYWSVKNDGDATRS